MISTFKCRVQETREEDKDEKKEKECETKMRRKNVSCVTLLEVLEFVALQHNSSVAVDLWLSVKMTKF